MSLLQQREMNFEKNGSQPLIGEDARHAGQDLFLETFDINLHHVGPSPFIVVARHEFDWGGGRRRFSNKMMGAASGFRMRL